MATRNGAKDDSPPGSILLVIHDFVARSADELSLAKGDRIELIERDDDFGDGWFLGRHMANGSTGLFPEVYTTPAPKGTLANNQRRVSEQQAIRHARSKDEMATQHRHSSASAAVQTRPASSASSQASTLGQNNLHSPVMNETLSVIDEHITDMHTPRSSYANGHGNKRDTITSVYSNPQALNRLSYIPGHETDEDDTAHTEEEVMMWSPERVAEYLEDHDVEKAHCNVFKEQEISGEVLLAMDQSSLFIKEFDLGPVGRRLKTWHKIKALQDEVRSNASPGPAKSNTSEYSAMAGAGPAEEGASMVRDTGRNRSSTIGTVLPRGLEPGLRQSSDGRSSTMQSSSTFTSNHGPSASPLPGTTSTRPESSYRPSAQNIRQMQHARRHSSIDSTHSAARSHRKHPSLDQKWQFGQPQTNTPQKTISDLHSRGHSASQVVPEGSLIIPASPGELERGYFSSNETENRTSFGGKKGNVLTKRPSNASSSSATEPRRNSFMFNGRQNAQSIAHRVIHSDDQPSVNPAHEPPNSKSIWSAMSSAQGGFSRSYSQNSATSPPTSPVRSATSPVLQIKPMAGVSSPSSPVVTKLDWNEKKGASNDALAASSAAAAMSNAETTASKKDGAPSPTLSSGFRSLFSNRPKPASGLRAISDAVTKNERSTAGAAPALKEGEVVNSPTRTGSTTPSTETRSFDLQKSMDGQSRASTGSTNKLQPPPPPANKRPRPKPKKATSAYTRGLQKQTPAEAMEEGCDYSGWMKKKSGSLMTTWKSRLFVLKGRRLSYYYRDDDTEEKGLIDISFHRVLPATNEMLTGMHAAITGAATPGSASPGMTSSGGVGGTQTNAERDLKAKPPLPGEGDESGIFIFKLVPPKAGLSKGVTFTKPTVHYFAVNSRQEGRLWMAALMKATIDRDDDGAVTTTYNQKTISLAKARARKERPPALKELEEGGSLEKIMAELDGGEDSQGDVKGLGIGGLTGEQSDDAALAGAEKDKGKETPDGASSIAPASTVATTEGSGSADELNEKEREAVALHSVG
ncbi:hypothetical protein KC340_g2683 [Hortaea werneckii]|nr:hypothetical protein KC342_g148 [Hortaea werneckii]KAI7109471.1 hypothetical protein KC339_g774 [Hortaea werneckii]KAI7333933.1 hypothetical protein KC340_g2683 [Hortaea werneckii]